MENEVWILVLLVTETAAHDASDLHSYLKVADTDSKYGGMKVTMLYKLLPPAGMYSTIWYVYCPAYF